MSWTDYSVNQILQTLTTGAYLALHYDDPSLGGLGYSEVSGGSYARQAAAFSSPANRATWNTETITFNGLPATTLAYIGIWDQPTGGNLLAYSAISPSVSAASGAQYIVAANAIALSFS